MDDIPYEIERKFLIRMPDLLWLASVAERSHIRQTYLLNERKGTSERVRSRAAQGRTVYTHTQKTHVSDMRRIEVEREIGQSEYERLLLKADPERKPIEKDRYCLRSGDYLYEIDIYPFWNEQAILEIELTDESQSFPWPEGIVCLREVTDDRRYTNSALARRVPEEELQKEE